MSALGTTTVRVVRDARHGWLTICETCGHTATSRELTGAVGHAETHDCEETR